MKKIYLLTALCGLMTLTGCGANPNSNLTANISREESKSFLMKDTVTSLSMLGGTGAKLQALNAKKANGDVSDEDKAAIEDALKQIDLLLSEDNYFAFESTVSDREGFEKKDVISFKDSTLTSLNYTLYYNTVVDVEVSIDKDGNVSEMEPIDKEDEDEVVKSTFSKGIAIEGENEYPFFFTTVEESSAEEQESFSLFSLKQGEGSFINVRNEVEIEEGEREFKYDFRRVEHKVTKNRFSIKVENDEEDQENEIKLILDKSKYIVEEKVVDGKTLLYVKFIDAKKTVKLVYERVITTNEDGTTSITYVQVTL